MLYTNASYIGLLSYTTETQETKKRESVCHPKRQTAELGLCLEPAVVMTDFGLAII